jgi:hypothetical protein
MYTPRTRYVVTGHSLSNRGKRNGRGGQGGQGGRGPNVPFCYFHGRDKGHWTNEFPISKQKKQEMEKQSLEPVKSVNYRSGGGGGGQSWTTQLSTTNPMPYVPQYLPLPAPPAVQLAKATSAYHHSLARSASTQGYDPVNYHLPPAPKIEPGQVIESSTGSSKVNNSEAQW